MSGNLDQFSEEIIEGLKNSEAVISHLKTVNSRLQQIEIVLNQEGKKYKIKILIY